jgi:hypothetical protein
LKTASLRLLSFAPPKESNKEKAVFCQLLRRQKNSSALLRNSLLSCALVFCPVPATMGLFSWF